MIEISDIDRLLAETLAIFEASASDNPVLEWVIQHDLDEDTMAQVGTRLTDMAVTVGEDDFEEAITNPNYILERIASSCVMSFMIGWLAHEQYGTKTT